MRRARERQHAHQAEEQACWTRGPLGTGPAGMARATYGTVASPSSPHVLLGKDMESGQSAASPSKYNAPYHASQLQQQHVLQSRHPAAAAAGITSAKTHLLLAGVREGQASKQCVGDAGMHDTDGCRQSRERWKDQKDLGAHPRHSCPTLAARAAANCRSPGQHSVCSRLTDTRGCLVLPHPRSPLATEMLLQVHPGDPVEHPFAVTCAYARMCAYEYIYRYISSSTPLRSLVLMHVCALTNIYQR